MNFNKVSDEILLLYPVWFMWIWVPKVDLFIVANAFLLGSKKGHANTNRDTI